jgi:hypothetical protein
MQFTLPYFYTLASLKQNVAFGGKPEKRNGHNGAVVGNL